MQTPPPRIFLSPPWLGGDEAGQIAAALASNYIAPTGPMVTLFEQRCSELCGIPHVAALSSGTAALDLLFHELNLGRGDRVFCSDLTFIASIAPAVHRGAEPVFIDSGSSNWSLDPALLAEALRDAARSNKLPKAVVAVDLYGECCDYDRLEELCQEYGVPLIIDAAEAVGSRYKGRMAGAAGLAAVYSFNGNKIITTSGGGLLASHDSELVARAAWRSQQAREATPWYEHRELGFNYRLSNISAAIGVGQLAHLPEILRRKQRIADYYRSAFADNEAISWMPQADYSQPNHWLSVMVIDATKSRVTPEQLRLALAQAAIESRPVWQPMHLQPVFAGVKCYGGSVAERLFRQGLCLPSGAGLSEAELARIVAICHNCMAG